MASSSPPLEPYSGTTKHGTHSSGAAVGYLCVITLSLLRCQVKRLFSLITAISIIAAQMVWVRKTPAVAGGAYRDIV